MIADVLLSLFNVRLLFIVSLVFLISQKPIEARKQTMGLERLIDRIFTANSYNPLVRPVDKYGMTNVFTELKLLQIDLDEKYQELVSTVWIEMSWEDERLSWNESDYDNIKEITLPVSKLWVPDIVLQNGVGRNEYLNEMKYFNPWISNTGLITWVPEIRLHSRCMIKVSDFPFDTQCCEINFYSWAHTINQMKIQQYGDKNITNLTHLSFNTEWQVYHTCALHKIIVTSEELHWWVTSYVIYIKRHTAYHIYNLLMPCFVLSMLSMLLFLLPPDSGEKVTLGVTILLAFFVNSLVVSNYTPEAASDLPVIAVYYIFNICLVSVSMGTSVCVLNFHFRGHKVSPVPIWLKYALIIRDDRIYNRCSNNDKLNGVSIYGENKSKQNGGKDMNGEAIVVRDSVSNSCHQRHYHQKSSSATKLKLCSSPSMPPSTSTHLLAKQTTHTILIPPSASPLPSPRCRHHHSHNHQQSSRNNHKPFNQMKTFDLVYCSDDEERINDVTHVRSNGGVTTSNESGTTTSTPVSSSNASSSSEWSLMRENLSKIQKLLKRSVFILERSRLRERSIAVLNDEWKEVASRIDLILFLIASTIVIFTPIGLFGKFFIRDDFFRNMNHTCGCENIH